MSCLAILWKVVVAVGLMLALWGFWFEPASLKSSSQTLRLANWPAECNGYRIAVLADLHTGSPHNDLDNLRRVVSRTLEADPDLVLLAGDFVIHGVVGGEFVPPEAAASVLQPLTDKSEVFAVLGNHDWWLNPVRVRAALETRGISFLEDAATELIRGNCRFWLAGVSDFMEGAHDVGLALRDIPAEQPTVVFTHNPDIFPAVPARVSLTIAGHTHGGQVYIPGIGRPVVPSRFGERYAIGHVVEDGRHLFVSPGIGTSILPVRFLVPPEISLLRLEADLN